MKKNVLFSGFVLLLIGLTLTACTVIEPAIFANALVDSGDSLSNWNVIYGTAALNSRNMITLKV